MTPREAVRLARLAYAAWVDDAAPSMGAALAYYTLFSLAPLLLIVVAVSGFFFGDSAVRGELFEELAGLLGPDGARAIEALLANAARPVTGLAALLVGAVTLFLGASTVFGELQNALDRIWRAPAAPAGVLGIVKKRMAAFGMILGIAFLLMVSLALSALLSAVGSFWGAHFLDLALSFALTTLLFAMIYKLIPRVRLRWRDVWTGAAVTAALFALGKVAIGFYLGRASVASVFGAAGSLVAVMVWVYYSAQIFLFGAEITKVHVEDAPPQPRAPARIVVRPAANTPVLTAPGRGTPGNAVALAKLGAALALGVGASIGLKLWRRR